MEQHVNKLEEAVMNDAFPEDEACLRTFLFDRLRSEEEA